MSRLLWVIVIFGFVPYFQNIICLYFDSNTISHMYEFSYNSGTVLYQFLETVISNRTKSGCN